MSQKIYNFIKFLEKKEGRKIPPLAVLKYGTDEEKRDEGIQLAVIEEDPFDIEYIEYPTEPVQLAAVEQEGYLIQFIDKPTEAVQLAAVRNNYRAFQFIYNPTELVQLAAVKKDGYSIKYIYKKGIEPTPKVKEAAYNTFMRKYGEIPNDFKKYFD